MSHTAELIAVGTELLLGNITNTNAQVLSESLSALGINVFWHTVVGDNPTRLREALEIMDLTLLDHIIVADDDFVSLRDSGYLHRF